MSAERTPRRALRRAIFAALALAAVIAIGWLCIPNEWLDVKQIVAWLRGMGAHWWAPLAFLAAYVVLTLFAIPPQPLSVAAVVVWGWRTGGAIELVVATLAAMPPFEIARTSARPWMEARLAQHGRIMELLRREGFTLLLVLRLIPVLPYPLLNYVAGFSSVRPIPYAVATLLGMVPSVFIFAYAVDALLRGVIETGDIMRRLIIAGVLLGALVIGTRLGVMAFNRRRTMGSHLEN